MAGSEIPVKAVYRLKLLVDKKKNKVVLAEAGKEFVDELFSILKLPMGTIVRVVEKYEKNQVSEATMIGCFNNLSKSALNIGSDNFMTEACQYMLVSPCSVKVIQRKWVKFNVDDAETLKYYTCPNGKYHGTWRFYSNFCFSKCICGSLMTLEFKVNDEEIFVGHKPLFTITDNLKVGITSSSHTLKTLKLSGYSNFDQLHVMLVDADLEKVLALLQCLFSSKTPLTDVFLTEKRSPVLSKVLSIPSLAAQEEFGGVSLSKSVISVNVFTRKLDMKVLYVECEKDFVDLLFTFLVLPLNSAWKLAGSNLFLGCIDNFCESFNSSIDGGNALNNKCTLPYYYCCQQPLLDVCYAERMSLTAIMNSPSCNMSPKDPEELYSGFLRRGITFMVSDDLTVTPIDLSSTICSLKKWNLDFDDIEEHVINITKAEAIRLLRASFVTTNALNSVFQSLLLKKRKQENV